MMKKPTGILFAVGILVGVAIKWATLFYPGVWDMEAYRFWGREVLKQGLPNYYPGVYYPLQMQVFEVCAWTSTKLAVQFFTIFKLSNLLFDVGSFVLLIFLLKRQRANPAYALLYWLHPWFLTVFSLGYVDFQFTFFVLVCVWLLRGESTREYLLAGLPLAAAFMMKPQAQILLVAAFCYGLFRYLRRRDARPLGLMAAPILFFLAYEIWFIISRPAPWYVAARVLPASYLNVTNVMPVLTAQMPNIWTPIAYLIKGPGHSMFVNDRIHVLPHVPVKYLAAFVVLGLVALHVWRIEKEPRISPTEKFAKIFLFAALAVPFFMTSAHENHLFLGTVFLVLLGADEVPGATKVAIQILLLIQFLNVYSLYEQHPPWLAQLLRRMQSAEWEVVYALISLICFWFIARPLWSQRVAASSTAA
jgi:hypothetical protein